MPEKIEETYRMMLLCNSLNAYQKEARDSSDTLFLYVYRAQDTIWQLLKESGRLDEFKKWEEAQNGKKTIIASNGVEVILQEEDRNCESYNQFDCPNFHQINPTDMNVFNTLAHNIAHLAKEDVSNDLACNRRINW